MKSIFKLIWIFAILVGLFSSCTKDEDPIFSETPSERIRNNNSELLKLLLNEAEGYQGIYFSKNDEYGGATFYLKFNEDGTVQSTSDFDDKTDLTTSDFEVRPGTSATELIFTTRGHIHKMSDPSSAKLKGKGFKGTSVFQYFGNDEGVLKFRDIRNPENAFFTLKPTGFTNFEKESIQSAKNRLKNRREFSNSPLLTPFPFMSVQIEGKKDETYTMQYDDLRFFVSLSQTTSGFVVPKEKFGIAFNEDGLVISPPIERDGVKFEIFERDNSKLQYISKVGNSVAKIGYSHEPVAPIKFYDFGKVENNARYNYLEDFKSSKKFDDFYKAYLSNVKNKYNLTISRIYLRSLNNGKTPYIQFYTNLGKAYFGISFTVKDGIVKFALTGKTNVPSSMAQWYQPLLDVLLLAPQGYYLMDTGRLFDFYLNGTFSMINVADPTMWINYFDF